MDQDFDRRLLLGAAGLAGFAAVGKLAHARGGPITPPGGAVASTGRTMLEVEPRIPVGPTTTPGTGSATYSISQPGSYYLTGNIAGVTGKHGIEITSSNVTVDLMGFEVRGLNPGGNAFSGVFAQNLGLERISVRNGRVNNWGSTCVHLGAATMCAVQGVTCTSLFTVDACIRVGDSSLVEGCTVETVQTGIIAGKACAVVNCRANGCAATGVSTGTACSVTGCQAENCGTVGFLPGYSSLVAQCTVRGGGNGASGAGIRATGCTVLECSVQEGGGTGIAAVFAAVVQRCLVQECGEYGISATTGSTVCDCQCIGSGSHGIAVVDKCDVRNNVSRNNSGHGIAVFNTGNRVEGNHCTGNDRGIDVVSTGNLIIRNSVSANSGFGYAVVANNLFGPNIFNSAGLTSSTNPHANYEF